MLSTPCPNNKGTTRIQYVNRAVSPSYGGNQMSTPYAKA